MMVKDTFNSFPEGIWIQHLPLLSLRIKFRKIQKQWNKRDVERQLAFLWNEAMLCPFYWFSIDTMTFYNESHPFSLQTFNVLLNNEIS